MWKTAILLHQGGAWTCRAIDSFTRAEVRVGDEVERHAGLTKASWGGSTEA